MLRSKLPIPSRRAIYSIDDHEANRKHVAHALGVLAGESLLDCAYRYYTEHHAATDAAVRALLDYVLGGDMPSPPIAAQHRTAANPDRLVRLAIAVTLTQAFADSDSAFVRAIDIAAKTLDQHFAEGGT